MNDLFRYRDLGLEYVSYGSGDDVIFAFHGFGRKNSDFSIFEKHLKPGQRIIAINLFAHSRSEFPADRIENDPLTKSEWRACMLAMMQHFGIEKFHLLGYSMGGRICLTTMEIMPEFVKSVLLLAPDGLKINVLYRFASGTKLGRRMYRSIIEKPVGLFRIAKWLNKLGFLNDKLHRFVHVHLDTREKRQQVHDGWLIYKSMFPDLEKTAAIIREEKIKFNMIFGKFDSVITPNLGMKFSKMIGTDKHLHVVEAGHRLLDANTIDFIIKSGCWP